MIILSVFLDLQNKVGKVIMNAFLILLLSPYWAGHFVVRRYLRMDAHWTIQKSLDLVWSGNEMLGYAKRELSLEAARCNLPAELYEADVYLHYGHVKEAQNRVENYLSQHPGDTQASIILQKIKSR